MKYYFLIVIAVFLFSCSKDGPSAAPPAPESLQIVEMDSLTQHGAIHTLISRISSGTMSRCIQDLTTFPTRNTYQPGCIDARDYLLSQLDGTGWNVSTASFLLNNTTAYNIIAEKKGIDTAEHAVIICSHYDSWGAGNSGANDNASGTAGVVAIAKSLEGMNISFHHTIRLIMFSGEEQGMHGSEAYVQTINPNSVMAVLNLDGIAPRTTELTSILMSYKRTSSNWLVDDFFRISRQYADSTGFENIYIYNNHSWGTDTDPFWSNNTSGVWILGNGEYPYANSSQDTFDKVDPVYGSRLVKAVAAVGFTLADPAGETP